MYTENEANGATWVPQPVQTAVVLLETEPRLFIAGAGKASPRTRFGSNVLKRPAAIPRYQINIKRFFWLSLI